MEHAFGIESRFREFQRRSCICERDIWYDFDG